MKNVKLYLDDDFKNNKWMFDGVPVFKELLIEEYINLWSQLIIVDHKHYRVLMSQDNNYKIQEVKEFNYDAVEDGEETYGESNIKCPICGYEVGDSWEYQDDSNEEFECPGCGSIISWERQVEVSYSAEAKKINKPVELC